MATLISCAQPAPIPICTPDSAPPEISVLESWTTSLEPQMPSAGFSANVNSIIVDRRDKRTEYNGSINYLDVTRLWAEGEYSTRELPNGYILRSDFALHTYSSYIAGVLLEIAVCQPAILPNQKVERASLPKAIISFENPEVDFIRSMVPGLQIGLLSSEINPLAQVRDLLTEAERGELKSKRRIHIIRRLDESWISRGSEFLPRIMGVDAIILQVDLPLNRVELRYEYGGQLAYQLVLSRIVHLETTTLPQQYLKSWWGQ